MNSARKRGGAEVRLRPLEVPSPIRVRTDPDGHPVEILPDHRAPATPGRRRSPRSGPERIAAIRETWRIDDEWWRSPVSRLYHEVILENGRILTLFRDLARGGWWTQ